MVDPIEGEVVDPDNPPVYGWREAPVSGGRVDLHEGPIIAGDPAGARVEVTETGLRAYDSTGTETASIAGEGGEFVGGSFRTSDTLPGQVTLSDTAAQGRPGVSIEPDDPTGYDVLPSIGPDGANMHVRGGVATDGSLAGALFGPAGVSLYQNGPGENGTGAWVDVAGMQADLGVRPDRTDSMYESGIRARELSVTAFSQGIDGLGNMYASPLGASINYKDPAEQTSAYTARAKADASGAELFFRTPGGAGGRLTVDAEGAWVERESAPNSSPWTRYNLDQLAKDTGRTEFPTVAGVTRPVPPTWRNKSEMILFNGTVNKNWVVGWNSVAIGMPLVTRPDIEEVRNAPIPEPGYLIRITPGGALDVYAPTAGARDVRLSGLIYPLG